MLNETLNDSARKLEALVRLSNTKTETDRQREGLVRDGGENGDGGEGDLALFS